MVLNEQTMRFIRQRQEYLGVMHDLVALGVVTQEAVNGLYHKSQAAPTMVTYVTDGGTAPVSKDAPASQLEGPRKVTLAELVQMMQDEGMADELIDALSDNEIDDFCKKHNVEQM